MGKLNKLVALLMLGALLTATGSFVNAQLESHIGPAVALR